MTVIVTGVQELQARIGKITAALKASESPAAGDAAEVIEQRAKDIVPVDSGELRDSIEVSGSGAMRDVEASAPHAPFVEFGTYKDAPQPFLQPAADEGSDEAVRAAAAIFLRAIT